MVAGIIIARGGSKRLPRKNVKLLCGHPLVAWSIMQSRCSHSVDTTVLSTDDDEIAEIGESYGAEIIRRPDWPDADQVSANRPFLHAIDTLTEQGRRPEIVVTMLPPCCLRLPDEIDRGIAALRKYGAESITPLINQREVGIYKKTHPWVARCVMFDKKYNYCTQTGGLSIARTEWYDTFNRQYSDLDSEIDSWGADVLNRSVKIETYWYPAEPWQGYEADVAEEWEFLEVLLEHFVLKGRGMKAYTDYREGRHE